MNKTFIVVDDKQTEMIHAFIGIITCSFCDIIPSLWSYFAAAGGRSVTIFSIDNDDSLRTVKTFTSQDKSEEYYTWLLLLSVFYIFF